MPKIRGRDVFNKSTNPQFVHCPSYLFTKLVYIVCTNAFSNTVSSQLSRLFSTINFGYLTSKNNGFYTLSTIPTIKTIKFNTLLLI